MKREVVDLLGVTCIATAVQRLYQVMRDMLRRLRPAALDELGVVPAIEEVCESWSARTGISCRFSSHAEPEDRVQSPDAHQGQARCDHHRRARSSCAPARGNLDLTKPATNPLLVAR
jgi:hypothetical protein